MHSIPATETEVTFNWLASIINKQTSRRLVLCQLEGDMNEGNGQLSTVIAVNVTTAGRTDDDQKADSYIIKLPPEAPERRQIALQGGFFSSEIAMYQRFFSELQNFAKERMVLQQYRFQPPVFLHGEQDADATNAIIIMENLQKDYRLADESSSFDLMHLSLVVRELALFHAGSVALKIARGIDNYCDVYPFLRQKTDEGLLQHFIQCGFNAFQEYFDAMPTKAHVAARLREVQLDAAALLHRVSKPLPHIGAIVHSDMHRGNLFFHYTTDKTLGVDVPTKLKIIDYQCCNYGRPTTDVAYFLLNTTDRPTRLRHGEELKMIYYDTFMSALAAYGVDFDYDYATFEADYTESQTAATLQLLLSGTVVMNNMNSTRKRQRYAEAVEDAIHACLI